MSAPHSTTEAIYDTETKMYAMYVNGELVGFAWDIAEARATLSEFDAPRYELLLDCAGPDVPLDGPSVEEEGGEGGEPPPDEWARFHPMADAVIHAEVLAAKHALNSGPPVWWELLAASPIAPAPSPLQPAPVGSSAAKAAYLARADKARTRWQELSEDSGRLAVWHGGRVLAYAANIVQVRRLRERLAEVA